MENTNQPREEFSLPASLKPPTTSQEAKRPPGKSLSNRPVKPSPVHTHHPNVNQSPTPPKAEALSQRSLAQVEKLLRDNRVESTVRDEDFLRIDQSRLPLELFDESGETPTISAGLVLACGKARSPLYDNGEWVWEHCTVSAYDEESQRFSIRFVKDGREKSVLRLSLVFDNEDFEKFSLRLQGCRSRREEAKAMARLDFFIRRQPTERLPGISDERWKRICILATQGVRAFHSFNDPESAEFQVFHETLANGVDEVEFLYLYILKKAVIQHLLKHSRKLRERFVKLRLPLDFGERHKIPLCIRFRTGVVLKQLRSVAHKLDISVHRQFLWFRSTKLKILPNTFPQIFSLEGFKRYNIGVCKNATDEIRHRLQELIVNHLGLDIEKRYRERPRAVAYKLRLVVIQLERFLNDVVSLSLQEWIHALNSVTEPILTIRVGLERGSRPTVSANPSAEEVLSALKDIVDVAMLELEKALTIEYNFLGVDDTLEGCSLEYYFDAPRMIKNLSPLLTQSHKLLSRLTQNVRHNLLSYNKISQRLPSAPVQTEMERLFGFMSDCNPDTDSDDLQRLTVEEKEVILEIGKHGLGAQVKALVRLREELERSVRTNTVCSGMFFFNASGFRQEISHILTQRIDRIVSRVFQIQTECADELNAKWEAMYKQLCARPCDEQDLRDQQEYLHGFEDLFQDLVAASVGNHRWKSVLAEAQFRIPPSEFKSLWTLKLWPNRIKSAAARCRKQVEAERRRMVDALRVEKKELNQLLDDYSDEIQDLHGQGDLAQMEQMVYSVTSLHSFLNQAGRQAERISLREAALGEPEEEFPLLPQLVHRFKPYHSLWISISSFTRARDQWLASEIGELNFVEIESSVSTCAAEAYRLRKTLSKVDPNASNLASTLREDCESFKQYLPLVRYLSTPAMKRRHWEVLCEEVVEESIDRRCSLELLLELGLMARLDLIERIAVRAEKEYGVEKSIRTMQEEWRDVCVEVVQYKETEGSVLTKECCEQIFDLLDDHLVKVQTVLSSPFVKPMLSIAQGWQHRLAYAHSLIEEILACQRRWTYLEPIFRSDDIKKQMPTEAMRFATIHTQWCKALTRLADTPKVLDLARDEMLVRVFEEGTKKLDRIFKGLTDYLDMKRFQFPRFFFLSNDELLEILAETKDARAVQPFLCKCFEGIDRVNFSGALIDTLISSEGERVPLVHHIDTESDIHLGNTELWLKALESSMRSTLLQCLLHASETYPSTNLTMANPNRNNWILNHAGQVVLTVSQLEWTKEAEQALVGGPEAIVAYLGVLDEQLKAIAMLVRGDTVSRLDRMTLASLCVLDVHQRDVVEELRRCGVQSARAFEWTAQLRYYWGTAVERGKNAAHVSVRLLKAEQIYANEYLGNSSRLVITPLTDRCYRTLMVAVELLYGGAPTGPAGTGKTETTKDLAKGVARQCIVFNCSEGLETFAMSKFFKGLVETGAWACFDEFNRIELDVLSVVAMQILTIVNAKRTRAKRFDFEGVTLTLNVHTNFFVTMNPGYAGRQELPDNLQALFRSCAMMVPDYALIAEIKLFSYGFLYAREMATKLTQVLILCSQQLSAQKHYDYGMRAVFAILIRAGRLREIHQDRWPEDKIVCTAVRDVNLPKFSRRDLGLFNAIVLDLFPTTKLTEEHDESVHDAAVDSCKQRYLEPSKEFLQTLANLHKTVQIRHGVMVVGCSGSGKSSLVDVLSVAMKDVRLQSVNPKSVTLAQLYGTFDEATREWQDGLFSSLFRACAQDVGETLRWIRLDGPVDAGWIEDINTVLDDNKRLCLQNGEIIRMTARMTMLFETDNLDAASPATVSRVGMIYLDSSHITPEMLVSTFFAANPTTHSALPPLLNTILRPCLSFLERYPLLPIPVTPNEVVTSVCRLLNSLLVRMPDTSTLKQAEEAMTFAIVWGVGSKLCKERFAMFRTFVKDYLKQEDSTLFRRARDLLREERFDSLFDTKSCRWQPWESVEAPIQSDFSMPNNFLDIIVPTPESRRNLFLMRVLVEASYPVLCVGPTGSGKTAWTRRLLRNHVRPDIHHLLITLGAQTTANTVQDVINERLRKRRRGVRGPAVGTQLVVVVDDLNLPGKDLYGSQPPIEFLRQWMDYGGWYQRTEWSFYETVDLQFMAAMGYPGGGRHNLPTRFTRHFFMLRFQPPHRATLSLILTQVCSPFFQRFATAVQDALAGIVEKTVEVYDRVRAEMLPTPTKPHYAFNLRDVIRLIQGICGTSSAQTKDAWALQKLWCHETMRAFCDRLVDEEERAWFRKMVCSMCSKEVDPDKLLYADFLDSDCLMEAREYVEVGESDMQRLVTSSEEFVEEHNSLCKQKLDLILFEYALRHLAHIAHVLSFAGSNLLLLGYSGSGRRTLARLTAVIAEQTIFQLELTRTYGASEWVADMKKLLRVAGVENRRVSLLLADRDIQWEPLLEDVNCLLGKGRVPALFTAEEAAQLCEEMGSADALETFFERCERNLHIILVFSPVGKRFLSRLRRLPNIVNCCAIHWFTPWPDDALLTVASRSLAAGSTATVADLPTVTVKLHSIAQDAYEVCRTQEQRYCYLTPRSLLSLVNTQERLYGAATGRIKQLRSKYQSGLEKIEEAAVQVAQMRAELEELKPQLTTAQAQADEKLKQVQAKQAEADLQKQDVEKDEEAAQAQTRRCLEQKAECEGILAKAIPALEAAVKALRTLEKKDIVEVKSMGRPPPAVKLTMECCCLLMGVRPKRVMLPNTVERIDDYWEPAKKKLLGDPKFLQKLLAFDKDNIDAAVIRKVKPYLEMPSFMPEVVQKASVAAAGLCKWVHAIVAYDEVAKMVAPRRQALAEANADLQDAVQALNMKQSELASVLRRLDALKSDLNQVLSVKEGLEQEVHNCRTKLERASQLLDGLSGEKHRWERQVDQLQEELRNSLGDSLVSAACVCYLGPLPKHLRERTKQEWRGAVASSLSLSTGCDVVSAFGDAEEIQRWVSQKLPNDELSIESAVIQRWSGHWPLMIDPQGQAAQWVRQVEARAALRVCKAANAELGRFAEVAMTEGSVLLLEDAEEEIDPVLAGLLATRRIRGSAATDARNAASVLHPEFRLYVTTKLSNPHFSPEVCSQVALLNFVATSDGLADQVMNITVGKERPELELQREELLKNEALNKRLLQQLEDKILQLLSQAKGSLLDDDRLVDSLAESQHTAKQILEQVESAQRTKMKIQKSRMAYEPVVQRAAHLFACITGLATVRNVYEFSLQWYLQIYNTALRSAPRAATVSSRVQLLVKQFTLLLYTRVSQCLFDRDRLMFAFLLAVKCMEGDARLDAESFRQFLFSDELEGGDREHKLKDVEESAWQEFLETDDIWDASSSQILLPLGAFERLLVAKRFRPDQLLQGIKVFIREELGEDFIHAPATALEDIYEASNPTQPVMFLLSAGCTPVADLTRLAKKQDGSRKLSVVSMGQGQHEVAENAVNQAAASGHWICLENCHVVLSWLPTLASLCEDLASRKLHKSFRLWLTCLPCEDLPVSLLQESYKVSLEAPRGLRAKMLRTFGGMEKSFFAGGPEGKGFKALVYGLSMFHAVVQERRSFGALGWNNPYQFSSHDLEISLDQLKLFLADYEQPPIRMLTYLVGELNYGGRVTDDNDRRTIMCILQQFYSADLVYKAWNVPWGQYIPPQAPEEYSLLDYKKHVRKLPMVDPPEILGLHPNASIRQSTQLAKEIVAKVALLQPRKGKMSGRSWMDDLMGITADVSQALPPQISREEVLERFPILYEKSLNTVLQQEVDSYNRLIKVIQSSIEGLKKGIAGSIAMTAELEETANALLLLDLPKSWADQSYPTMKGLHSWIKDLCERVLFMEEWIRHGTPRVFWIGSFFFVSAFLTAVRQDYARRNKVPIDAVCFRFNVHQKGQMPQQAEGPVWIEGLFLEGAGWNDDKKHLEESAPRVLLVDFPPIELSLYEARRDSAEATDGYMCPVYKTRARTGTLSTTGHSTNFVLHISLSCGPDYDASHWVKRSVALLISTDS